MYDGVVSFATAAVPGKLYEVAPYMSKFGFGAQFAGALGANKDWYDSQPEVVQKALKDAADAYKDAYLKDLDEAVTKGLETVQANGGTVTEVDAALRKQWADGMDNVAMQWAKALDDQGKPGTEVLKAYMEAMRAAGATPVRNWDQE